ncbi:hypothetical protein BO1005MUT1_350036 [Hyphomicrobiales bacterium]|nr:hypothetical protein BO1005MUT1_350036 [Hyphomicrobiales bacterium]
MSIVLAADSDLTVSVETSEKAGPAARKRAQLLNKIPRTIGYPFHGPTSHGGHPPLRTSLSNSSTSRQ